MRTVLTREGGDSQVPNRRFVCSLDELPPGGMKLVDVGKFGVGVYNVHGELYAIVNYCSHEGAPLCLGLIGGTNESAPESLDGMRRVRDGQIVRCPWHNWEFDVTTGQNLADPRRRVRTYQVDVTDGEVYLTA
ncbi:MULTISPECIES: Rieske (2Fe-2S) protein [unclassified Mycobacterium]|uniref:Rieske (2Fe-2S) protein n=1 Tax=unclassified Mycobacterium TaxID=2642494 RepID=UPI000800AD38|nr:MULTISPECIES: Rieske (2Fe-2S) protein [unclassified Mycobacterium]OBI57678.1 (2Fe-2S)-binding protein [Mycobacterium sp. E796]